MPDVVEVPENLTNWRLGNIEGTLSKVLEKLDGTVGLEDRVKRLEEWQTWALRIVVGAVLAGILALVLTQTK